MTKNQRLALYAAFLLAFETLFFVHSSIAVIDVGAIFFGLLGFLFYFAKVHWWKFGTMTLTGISIGARRPLQGDRHLPLPGAPALPPLLRAREPQVHRRLHRKVRRHRRPGLRGRPPDLRRRLRRGRGDHLHRTDRVHPQVRRLPHHDPHEPGLDRQRPPHAHHPLELDNLLLARGYLSPA